MMMMMELAKACPDVHPYLSAFPHILCPYSISMLTLVDEELQNLAR